MRCDAKNQSESARVRTYGVHHSPGSYARRRRRRRAGCARAPWPPPRGPRPRLLRMLFAFGRTGCFPSRSSTDATHPTILASIPVPTWCTFSPCPSDRTPTPFRCIREARRPPRPTRLPRTPAAATRRARRIAPAAPRRAGICGITGGAGSVAGSDPREDGGMTIDAAATPVPPVAAAASAAASAASAELTGRVG